MFVDKSMGNTLTLSPCCGQITSSRNASTALMVKLIFYGGETRILMTSGDQERKKIAGEIMLEFPDHMVCHADSFFIGRPIPALSIHDELIAGQTYFILPLDCFVSSTSTTSSQVLSVSSLASLGSRAGGGKPAVPVINNFRECPLQYVKSSLDGRILIKVMPEFMIKLIMNNNRNLLGQKENENGMMICSTPELKKHYEQLVGCTKVQGNWSPKLETISEYKISYSPCRFLGFERKLGEP